MDMAIKNDCLVYLQKNKDKVKYIPDKKYDAYLEISPDGSAVKDISVKGAQKLVDVNTAFGSGMYIKDDVTRAKVQKKDIEGKRYIKCVRVGGTTAAGKYDYPTLYIPYNKVTQTSIAEFCRVAGGDNFAKKYNSINKFCKNGVTLVFEQDGERIKDIMSEMEYCYVKDLRYGPKVEDPDIFTSVVEAYQAKIPLDAKRQAVKKEAEPVKETQQTVAKQEESNVKDVQKRKSLLDGLSSRKEEPKPSKTVELPVQYRVKLWTNKHNMLMMRLGVSNNALTLTVCSRFETEAYNKIVKDLSVFGLCEYPEETGTLKADGLEKIVEEKCSELADIIEKLGSLQTVQDAKSFGHKFFLLKDYSIITPIKLVAADGQVYININGKGKKLDKDNTIDALASIVDRHGLINAMKEASKCALLDKDIASKIALRTQKISDNELQCINDIQHNELWNLDCSFFNTYNEWYGALMHEKDIKTKAQLEQAKAEQASLSDKKAQTRPKMTIVGRYTDGKVTIAYHLRSADHPELNGSYSKDAVYYYVGKGLIENCTGVGIAGYDTGADGIREAKSTFLKGVGGVSLDDLPVHDVSKGLVRSGNAGHVRKDDTASSVMEKDNIIGVIKQGRRTTGYWVVDNAGNKRAVSRNEILVNARAGKVGNARVQMYQGNMLLRSVPGQTPLEKLPIMNDGAHIDDADSV